MKGRENRRKEARFGGWQPFGVEYSTGPTGGAISARLLFGQHDLATETRRHRDEENEKAKEELSYEGELRDSSLPKDNVSFLPSCLLVLSLCLCVSVADPVCAISSEAEGVC